MDEKLNAACSTALKETLKEVLKLIAVLLIIGFILFFTVSDIKSIFTLQRLIYLSIFLVIFIIFRYINLVYDLYNHQKRVENIEHSPEKVLLSSINDAKMISDRFKLKVDIYKSFSPLPIIVLLLTILVNNDNFKSIQKVEQYIAHFNMSDSLRFIYVIFSVIILVIYLMILMNNYNKYKNAQEYLNLYQNRYDAIKYNLEKEKLDREIEKHKLDIKKLELDIEKLQANK